MTLKPRLAILFIVGSMFPRRVMRIFLKFLKNVVVYGQYLCESVDRPQSMRGGHRTSWWFSPSSYCVGLKIDLRCGKHLYLRSPLAT